jgi:transcriptional regulator with XRE-family HTH domain
MGRRRALVRQADIAEKLNLDVSTVNKILRNPRLAKFNKETVHLVLKTAKEMGYEINRIVKYTHHRKAPRVQVHIPAEIRIIKRDGTFYDKGVAVIKEISVVGAKIADIDIPKKSFPLERFDVLLRPKTGEFKGCLLKGEFTRIIRTDKLSFGLTFTDVDQIALEKIERMVKEAPLL